MEISDIQQFSGKIEITFMDEFGIDFQTIILSRSDVKLLSEFINNI